MLLAASKSLHDGLRRMDRARRHVEKAKGSNYSFLLKRVQLNSLSLKNSETPWLAVS